MLINQRFAFRGNALFGRGGREHLPLLFDLSAATEKELLFDGVFEHKEDAGANCDGLNIKGRIDVFFKLALGEVFETCSARLQPHRQIVETYR